MNNAKITDIKPDTSAIRNINGDIMRFVAISMVLFLHFVGSGGFFVQSTGANYIIIHLVRSFCIVSVNVFFLASGYFNVKSHFKLAKLLRIILLSFIYSVVIGSITLLFFNDVIHASPKEIIKMFVPITADISWFITAYVGIYVLSPFINKMMHNLGKSGASTLIIILFIMLCLFSSIPTIHTFDKTNGYGLIWGIFVYIIGAYARLYIKKLTQKAKKYMIIYIFVSLLIAAISIMASIIWKRFGIGEIFIQCFYTYNNVFTFTSSFALFLYFVLKPESIIRNTNSMFAKCITATATSTLGIYLIHQNIFLREVLWCNILMIHIFSNSLWLFAYMLLCCVCILTVSVLIDKLLQKFLDIIFKSKLYSEFDAMICDLFSKLNSTFLKF